jgi:hypothetical protein
MARFEIAGCGVDDITIGFDMTGSRSLGRLGEMPGLPSRRGKMLGDRASWGSFAHLLGRSVSFWRPETRRLYVQAKLAEEGKLCRLSSLREAVRGLLERMAVVGLVSYERPWVTRLDVAVDGLCRPADGKLLLDAIEACRPPNGWRTHSVRSSKVLWETVLIVAARANVRATTHALRRAFAVAFLESHPGALESLQALMNHSRIDTTQVYLRALNRTKAMEAVRDLSWGSGFQSRGEKAHTGFEPVPPP